jgi:glycine betaine catabolism A
MATFTNTRAGLPPGVLTLPGRYYSDPTLFAREMEHIHYAMWLCAGREEQIKAPGDYFVRQIGNASIVILREQNGGLRAFHNVCRHRGTMLCHNEEGKLPGKIRCAYHGWTYALDGRLIGAPHMEKVAGFRDTDFALHSVAVDIWAGHIFINLSSSPQPLAEQLADLPTKFKAWGMDDLRLVERKVYHLKANWKLVIQNYSECLHCPVAHPQLKEFSHYMSGENEDPQPTYMGGYMSLQPGVPTMGSAGADTRKPFPGLSDEDARRVYYYAVLPNLLLNLHPDYMMALTLWPLAPDRTDVVCEWHFHPDAIASPDFDPSGAIDFWDITNKQDWELSDLAQRGISSRGYTPGPYSNREELLHALDAWVVERIGDV